MIAIVSKPPMFGKTLGYLLFLFDLNKKILIGENDLDVDKSDVVENLKNLFDFTNENVVIRQAGAKSFKVV